MDPADTVGEFLTTVKSFKQAKSVAKGSRLLQQTPIIDENRILRIRGHVTAAENVRATTQMPVILDSHHPYTRLLVLNYHQQVGHGTAETVLNELRYEYWIVQAKPTAHIAP